MKVRVMLLVLFVLFVGTVVAQDKPPVTPLEKAITAAGPPVFDEMTRLRLENGIMKIQSAQKDIDAMAERAGLNKTIRETSDQLQKDFDAFCVANKLDPKEWGLDPQKMTLVRKNK